MDFDLVEIIKKMGAGQIVFNSFMILMGLYSLYIIIERALTFSKATRQNIQYVMSLRNALSKRDLDGALAQSQQYTASPVARVMEGALKAVKTGQAAIANHGPDDVGEFDVIDAVNRSLDRIKERETNNLRRGLSALATVASSAPFVGLSGTVLGIMHAFGLLKGGSTIEVIGPAIAEALLATLVGLVIAIIAAIFFNTFTTQVEQMSVDMNDVSSEFVDFVLLEGRK